MKKSHEAEKYSLRELIREEMVSVRNEFSDVKSSLAKIETHHGYTSQSLKDHAKDIDMLKTAHNNQKGALKVFGAIGGIGGMAGFIAAVKQYLSTL